MKVFKVRMIVSMVLAMLIDLQLFAQTGSDSPPVFGSETVTDVIPLDGGLSLLLAAGVALGVKKAHQYRKRK